MKVKKTEYNAATGEYKEIYEEDLPAPEEPEITSEPSLEEKVQELQNNVLNLQSVLISQKISGGGITITDSSALSVKDFGMRGKTEQASTTGKNLFDITKLKSNMISAENIDIEESTITLPAGGAIYFNKLKDVCTDLKVGDEVYLFAKSTGTKAFAGFYHETASTPSWNFNTKQIVTDEMLNGALLLYSDSDKSVVLSGIMITKLNDKTYEPYTGGKPSPSVEYPQEIINAGDDGSVGIKVTGKNLFDISKLKIEHDEEKIIIKQTDVYLKLAENFEDNTRYTVSFESYKNDGSSNHVLFEYVYTDGSRSEWYANSIPVKGFASSANKTIDYLWIRNPWKAYAEITKIQVEKGTERTVYEPYKDPQVIAIPLDRPFTKWDRLEKRDGVYGIVCKSKEVVFDGSGDEIWRNQTDLIGNTQFYITLDDSSIKNTPDFIDNFYCDKFTKTSKTGDIAIGEVRYGILKYTFAPVFKPKDEVNTLSLWRNLLKENTIKVTYITDAEEFAPLPEETQIALNALHTYYPTTVMSNSENCEMEVEYICDTKNYVDKQIQGIVTKQIETNNLILERTM